MDESERERENVENKAQEKKIISRWVRQIQEGWGEESDGEGIIN
jgi:hypothetical protein